MKELMSISSSGSSEKHKLEVDSILLSFNNRRILSDIFLKVETGEVVGILGRNGSGKSSLLKIIFGLINAENKSVRLDGRYQPELYKENEAIKYLTQQPLFPNNINVVDVVNLFIARKSNRRSLFDIEEIGVMRNKRIGELSGGQRRFLEVMTLLHSDTKFLLMDEPFSHVSPVQIEIINQAIQKQLPTKGIILTDHIFQYVLDLSKTKYFLKDGKLLKFDNREELIELGYINN